MKRQTQTVGVRNWAGDDLVSLQSETLAALDAFFAEYGPCVIQGCEITVSTDGSGTYDVAEGLVALMADDQKEDQQEDQKDGRRVMVMPFAGAKGVALPLYLTAAVETISEEYGDGKVKPIAYSYKATAVGAEPGEDVPYLTLTEAGGNRFVDVVQDEGHRFITDNERAKWNAILQQAKEYADSVAATGSAAALRSAKEYTDQREVAILAEVDTRDDETLKTAKEYADTIVAALADSAPETLDTLQELAAALGNDPNFSATVMQMIGERVTTEAMNNALAGKANLNGDLAKIFRAAILCVGDSGEMQIAKGRQMSGAFGEDEFTIAYMADKGRINLVSTSNPTYTPKSSMSKRYEFWHAGNFDPTSKAEASKLDGAILGKGLGQDVQLDVTDVGTGFQYNKAGSGVVGPFITFGHSGYLVQITTNTSTWQNGHFNIKYRVRNGDNGTWSDWLTFYHSGNLVEATSSAAGLMSAADKTKLDGIAAGGMKLLGAGVFDFNSLQLSKKTGCVLSGYRNGVGNYRISHNIGHTNYEVQATCSPTNGSNGGYTSIRTKTATYFDVYTGDDDSPNDLSFFFQIYEFV